MKRIVVILVALILLSGCNCDENRNGISINASENIHFINEKCIVESKGVVENHLTLAARSIKHKDTVILYQGIGNYLKNEKFYSTKIGDTLFFNYIKKDRFFRSVNVIELNNDNKIEKIQADLITINNKLDSLKLESLLAYNHFLVLDTASNEKSTRNYLQLRNEINDLKMKLWQRKDIK